MKILKRIFTLSTEELHDLQAEILLEIQRRKEALMMVPAGKSGAKVAGFRQASADCDSRPPRRRAA